MHDLRIQCLHSLHPVSSSSGFSKDVKVAVKSFGGGQRKHKHGLQSGPGLLLVSGLGFAIGQSCFA